MHAYLRILWKWIINQPMCLCYLEKYFFSRAIACRIIKQRTDIWNKTFMLILETDSKLGPNHDFYSLFCTHPIFWEIKLITFHFSVEIWFSVHRVFIYFQLSKCIRTCLNVLHVKTGSHRKVPVDKCIILVILVTVSGVSQTTSTFDDSLDSAYSHTHSYDLLQWKDTK